MALVPSLVSRSKAQKTKMSNFLCSHKGTKTLTEFFATFYACRTFGNSAAPKIGSCLVNQFWGLNTDGILQPLLRKVVLSQKVDMLP